MPATWYNHFYTDPILRKEPVYFPDNFMKLLIIYFVFINLAGFSAMLLDKQKAKRHLFRIPEKTLFLFAFLGGSLGTTLGMNLFRHKTKHWYFKFGMPLILILQICLGVYLFIR